MSSTEAAMNKPLTITLLACTIASCATVPAPLQGQYAASTPREAHTDGQAVRWGGEIIKVEPKEDSTCFEVLARELDASARPTRREGSQGRFIACRSGFYDPEEYDRGREVTVVGQLSGIDHGKVGQFDYSYPHVVASEVYLWPKRVPRAPYYDPWMYGFGPNWGWYGPGWGPYWGAPPIIIRERPHPSNPPPPGH
jgi:outer membrane lipoprotein